MITSVKVTHAAVWVLVEITVLTQNNWLCQRIFLEIRFNSKTNQCWDLITRGDWKQAAAERNELIGLCKIPALEIELGSVIVTWGLQSQWSRVRGSFAKPPLHMAGLDVKRKNAYFYPRIKQFGLGEYECEVETGCSRQRTLRECSHVMWLCNECCA